MTITVAKLKRALEETAPLLNSRPKAQFALQQIALSPEALTILAEKLSERPRPQLVMDHRTGVVSETRPFDPSTSPDRG